MDVFISYSSKNKNVADAVVSEFEQHGITCWYAPRNIMPGQEWVTAIHEAIKECKVFVLIYTDSSNESRQVANEVALAFNSGKILIPFRLSEAEMSTELEYYLTRVHWMDAVNSPLTKSAETLREYTERMLRGEATGEDKERNANNLNGKKDSGSKKIVGIAVAALILVAVCIVLVLNLGKNKTPKSDSTSSKTEASTENSTTENTSPTEAINPTEATAPTESPTEATTPTDSVPPTDSTPDPKELYELAYKYQTENLEENNRLLAYEYYMKTGDAITDNTEISDAIYRLGSQFCNGEGTEQDYEKGIALFKKAIACGNTSAMNMMGNLYLYGDGVDEDYSEAAKYYSMAADLGDETAKKNLEYLKSQENQ